ncbi:acyl-CoA dehydrogenase family protein [Chloroflexota bacterium]
MIDFELTEEQKGLQQRAKNFIDEEIRPHEKAWPEFIEDWDKNLRAQVLKKAEEAGVMKLSFPKEYGGQGLSHLSEAIVKIELRKASGPIGGLLTIQGDPFPAMYEGTEYQKEKYLWPVLRYEKDFAFAFTEPVAGSDFKGIQTTAVKKGDNWVLNGRKVFCSGAHHADFTFVCAYTDESKGSRGMNMFYVDKETPGWEVERLLPMFVGGSRYEPIMKLENCVVPAENMVGGEKGFAVGMGQFNRARVSIAEGAVAKAERSLELAIDYAKKRYAFGRPIGQFGEIQRMITNSKIGVDTMRWLLYHTAWKWDRGESIRLDAAMTKVYCVETGLRVIDDCMQVFGGIGLTSDYPMGDYYRELRQNRSAEGTLEIMRYIMARDLLGDEVARMPSVA